MRDYNFEAQVFAIVEASIEKAEATPKERMTKAFKQHSLSMKWLDVITDSHDHSTWEEQADVLELYWSRDYVSICLDEEGYASVMVSGGEERELKSAQLKRLLKAWSEDARAWELADMVDRMRA